MSISVAIRSPFPATAEDVAAARRRETLPALVRPAARRQHDAAALIVRDVRTFGTEGTLGAPATCSVVAGLTRPPRKVASAPCGVSRGTRWSGDSDSTRPPLLPSRSRCPDPVGNDRSGSAQCTLRVANWQWSSPAFRLGGRNLPQSTR